MPLVIVGVLLLALKLAEIGPVANWSWWIILGPFGAAAVWWQIADATGLTKRREMDKMEVRKQERRDRALEALGIDTKKRKKYAAAPDSTLVRPGGDSTLGNPPPPEPPRRG